MESKSRLSNEVVRRTRRMMLLLPVIVVPLMTIGFYALGGGRGERGGKGLALTKGLNMSLPEAKFDTKKKVLNKLGFYKQSEQDSMRLVEKRKMDPYYGVKDSGKAFEPSGRTRYSGAFVAGGLMPAPAPADSQADDLMRKLDELKGVLNRREQGVMAGPPSMLPSARVQAGGAGMIPLSVPSASVAAVAGEGDPDLEKLNSLMDKVLRVRYPGDPPLRDSTPAARGEEPVQALTIGAREEVVTTLAAEDSGDLQTGFIGLDEEPASDSVAESMIPAVVDGRQTIVSGEAVGLRTAVEAMLGGIRVPRGTSLSGKAVVAGERLMVSVNAVRLGTRVIPVSLDVFDMDGMAGIRVKGSINRDVSKESASEAVGALGVTSLDPSVAGQATAAGIQAAKNLLGRKIRLIRLGLPAGYRVLLRNRSR